MSLTATDHGPSFAVVGATGQQGGATVRALMDRGVAVRALTRDPSSTAARSLTTAGVEVVAADLADHDSLVSAFTGVAGVFAMTTFTGPRGTAGEVEDGQVIGDAAVTAKVPRVVYSSVGGAERETGVPHFDSKWAVERYLADRVPVSFLRPTYFMDNLAGFLTPKDEAAEADQLVVAMPLADDITLEMVAVRDIGVVAAAALLDESRLPAGASIEIAGAALTGTQIAEVIGRRLGRPSRYTELSLDVLGEDEDLKSMFRWLADTPAYQADFEATRVLDRTVWDLAAWVDAQG